MADFNENNAQAPDFRAVEHTLAERAAADLLRRDSQQQGKTTEERFSITRQPDGFHIASLTDANAEPMTAAVTGQQVAGIFANHTSLSDKTGALVTRDVSGMVGHNQVLQSEELLDSKGQILLRQMEVNENGPRPVTDANGQLIAARIEESQRMPANQTQDLYVDPKTREPIGEIRTKSENMPDGSVEETITETRR